MQDAILHVLMTVFLVCAVILAVSTAAFIVVPVVVVIVAFMWIVSVVTDRHDNGGDKNT